ncbi:MAG: hypothetical protein B6229_05720 [Spirochaetaceae bacterium 4572_7]|nr:MAG: hypothetical protein B6229_05720 [Spirochaetaceae bacterium 4572_7]
MGIVTYIIFVAMTGWAIFSISLMVKLSKSKTTDKINLYVYRSIPSVFTSLGVLGTFLGIVVGLWWFDVANIDSSIPILLDGMKTAFITSIAGIILSIIFRIVGQIVLNKAEDNEPVKEASELSALNSMITLLADTKKENKSLFATINDALVGDNSFSLSNKLSKITDQLKDNKSTQDTQQEILSRIDDSFMYTKTLQESQQVALDSIDKKLRDTNDISIDSQEKQSSHSERLLALISDSNEDRTKQTTILNSKIDDFAEIMIKNNTESLVDVMKQATESFNAQMSDLLDKLIQENFKELNSSVNSLNTWQKENKEMVSSLTDQFFKVSDSFSTASTSIKDISDNTGRLVSSNGYLSELIKELQAVMVDDTKFKEISNNLFDATDLVKTNIIAFDETTSKLNTWILSDKDFKDSIDILIARLQEVEKIKDINGEFWSNTKIQLEEGVSLITNSSTELRENLDNISEEFTGQLNQTLISLDELIQRLIENKVRQR